jgi:hypothetical protein
LPAVADEVAGPFFTEEGLAIRGYDPVAYFQSGEPKAGDPDFSYDWQGAIWRFASAENRNAFAASPETYAPQYGGYCAYAAAQDYVAPVDPEAWTILDGKLYLNFSGSVRRRWQRNVEDNIRKGDANWPGLRQTIAR